MMNERISVIIPYYQSENTIEQTIISIQQQTYTNIEIIVVDDGSPIPLTLPQFPSVRILLQEHKGAPAARNRGANEATGDYYIFWDADIIGVPTMLEHMVHALHHAPDVDFVYGNFYFGTHAMKGRPFDPAMLRKGNYIPTTSLLRASAYVLWDESLKRFQDWDFWLQLVTAGKKGVWVPKYFFTAHVHKKGISTWLPSFAYRIPWRWFPCFRKKVAAYERAKHVIMTKHQLFDQ